MSDGIYAGWGNRAALAAWFKSGRTGAKRSGEARALSKELSELQRARRAMDLDSSESLSHLGRLIARGVMLRFVEEPDEDRSGFDSLPFFRHLASAITGFLGSEQPFALPTEADLLRSSGRAALWEADDRMALVSKRLASFERYCFNIEQMFALLVEPILSANPSLLTPSTKAEIALRFDTHLVDTLPNLAEHIEQTLHIAFAPDFDALQQTVALQKVLEHNLTIASGGLPGELLPTKSLKLPTKSSISDPYRLVETYLQSTPLIDLYDLSVPIELPDRTRFEHHHIVAGSGHGKTQTLQHLIAYDLPKVMRGEASVIIIDSQGDLINRISKMAIFAEGGALADRIVLIDPSDVEYPVSLNLFDIGIDRINQYSQLDRERMINGVLELYDFVLGSLLDAQMTQKQSVIFRYITRLMLHIPDATIETLRDLLEDGGADRQPEHIERLQGSAKAFFTSEFDSREFTQTKRQVLRRLWGILENQSFERMFMHPRNKLDLFTEMNSGKVILINTAKDLLKEEGTQIFGRFFIAMIAQAAQERSIIPAPERMPTFVYIDEAQDYFDRNVGIILSQARKYKVGMVLAHQFLGQLDTKLQESVFANTSIKFAGGVSVKDARTLASELRTTSEFIEHQETLEFAGFIRGTTKSAATLRIEPGILERQQQMSEQQFQNLRDRMRDRYAVHYSELSKDAAPEEMVSLEAHGEVKAETDSTTNLSTPTSPPNTDTDTQKPAPAPKTDNPLSTDPQPWP